MHDYAQLVRAAARSFPDRIAVEDDDGVLTYRDLDEKSAAMAIRFRSLGLRAGDAVAWLSPNTASYPLAMIAAARLGLRISPMNFWLRDNELRDVLGVVRPRCVMAAADYASRLDPLCDEFDVALRLGIDSDDTAPGWLPWSEAFDGSGQDFVDEDHHDSPHELIFTSGTTGQVKGAASTQGRRILDAESWLLGSPLDADSHLLAGAPQFHVGAQSLIAQVLISGGRLRVFPFSVERLVELIASGGTHIVGVPAHFAIMFESGMLDFDTAHVRTIMLGGNALPSVMSEQLREAFPEANISHVYGSTESGLITMIAGDDFIKRPTSIGRASVGVEVRIVDVDGAEVGVGEVGELTVRNRTHMLEYYRRPDLTAQAFTDDGWLRMGDLGMRDAEGFLYIVGRKKDMIITGGENVYPQEVEDVIRTDIEVLEVAVVSTPDPLYGESVVAVVRREPGDQVDAAEFGAALISAVKERLAGYKAPKYVVEVEDFPRNALGKIDKVRLRELVSELSLGAPAAG